MGNQESHITGEGGELFDTTTLQMLGAALSMMADVAEGAPTPVELSPDV